jgi:hypothetical protein
MNTLSRTIAADADQLTRVPMRLRRHSCRRVLQSCDQGTKLVTRDLLLELRRPGCRLVLGIGGHPTGEVNNDAITATAQGRRRIPTFAGKDPEESQFRRG